MGPAIGLEPITVLKRICVAAIAAAALAVPMLTATAPPAAAEDQRPCVSRREYVRVPLNADRQSLEKLWEVRGRGHRIAYDELPEMPLMPPDHRAQGRSATHYAYRFCGYPIGQKKVIVSYRPAYGRLWYWVYIWKRPAH